MKFKRTTVKGGSAILLVLMLVACGGGGGAAGGSSTSTYTVGGTIAGLTGTGLVLQDNGGDNLAVSSGSSFTFAKALNNSAAYAVTVSTQPTGQVCTVSSGTGTISGANVTNIAVGCATNSGTAPTAPSAPTASPVSESSILITWTDNSSDETGFYVERSISASGTFTQRSLPPNATAYSDSGLNPSTTYYYRIAAFNINGASSYTSVVNATTSTPASAAPAAPSALVATAASSTSISLSWTDNSNNESGFKIERGATAAGPFSPVVTTTANAVNYGDTGLTAATTYYYRIKATNGAGDSSYTAVASAATPAVVTVPAALVGTWKSLNPNDVLIISADGTFAESIGTSIGCSWGSYQWITSQSGTVSVSGSTLTLNRTSGDTKYWGCGVSTSSTPTTTTPSAPGITPYTWSWVTAGTVLNIAGAGTSTDYTKQ